MAPNDIQLVWFKRDLRIADHEPLVRAGEAGRVLGLYVYEPSMLAADDFDPMHLRFLNQSLAELRDNLARLGAPLVLRVGELPDVFETLHQQTAISALWSHQETGNWLSFQRDIRVRAWARERGIPWHEVPYGGVVRALKDRDGWSKRWYARMKPTPLEPPKTLRRVESVACEDLRSAKDLSLSTCLRTEVVAGGEQRANEVLETFLADRGVNYRADMSSPVTAWSGCSRLSPHLAWGNISVRQVFHETQRRQVELRARRDAGEPYDKRWLPSLSSFQGRLRWHCHFIQKLESEPELEFRNMNRGFDGMRENDFDEARFDAWRAGETGYPMVDACMRALHTGGWINFRMRAMLVSFASYHLWLHWVRPSRYLARQFLDYEPGIHYTQFQMQSGVTGINALRIYSPRKQVEDQDPRGVFIRRYVPELAGVPDEYLPEPHTMPSSVQQSVGCIIGRDYPAPIVDHGTAYKEARSRVYSWRARPEVKALADEVYDKHGSRKRPPKRRKSPRS